MVRGNVRKFGHWIAALWLLCLPSLLMAASLSASVDRDEMGINDTLRLTVVANSEIEINLGSIFNLQNLELPEPELGDLREQFEVLDTNQSYSIRSVNGQHNAEVTWTYLLAPQKTGELEIPKLTYKDAETAPIAIKVKEESPGGESGTDQNAFIEASFDKSKVYVQEELTLTVRLFYQPPLLGGELEEPEPDNAIIEQLQKQRETTATRNGRVWRVVERSYVLYPQKSGTLEIPPLEFQGRRRDARGDLQFLRTRSQRLSVTVEPPPDSFTGDNWIPASSLVLDENWSKDPEGLKAGDSITRTLTLRALGLLGSALPPIDDRYPEAVKDYPEQPQLDSKRDSDTIQSTRTEATAIVPVQGGTITLPAVRIPWWDTVNDVQRVAEIPERTLRVEGGAAIAGSSGATPGGTGSDSATGGSNQSETGSTAMESVRSDATSPWLWVAIVLAVGWAATIALWVMTRGTVRREQTSTTASGPASPSTSFDQICRMVRDNDPAFLHAFPAWARQRFDKSHLRTLQDTVHYLDDPALAEQVALFEAALYSPHGRTEGWDPDRLIERLKALTKEHRRQVSDNGELPPLYPVRATGDQS